MAQRQRGKSNATTASAALRQHWHLYLFEGAELAIFMLSACFGDVLLYSPASPISAAMPSLALRGLAMGAAMGVTAVLIIHSPMGRRSGAHFNPSITLTYLWLGKIAPWDTTFYVAGQFAGGIAGVGVAALFLGKWLAPPPVLYAITVPGKYGTDAAFAAEFFMAALLMGMVLWTSNRAAFAKLTSYLVGVLITFYVLLFGPVSGFSINPARTVGSACFAHIWTAIWLYFTAPLLGMFLAAQVYVLLYGKAGVLCAKLHHGPSDLPSP
ncbi:aquaporin [Granulicella sp. 5B5]|uniref:MIP/aquaporin family protein n=1 Tax=Granulicella sp. 5B5 TaxID=1617967 RepID=UPI001C715D7C|nr:aquaporin [Granulicella sp. 5B5]